MATYIRSIFRRTDWAHVGLIVVLVAIFALLVKQRSLLGWTWEGDESAASQEPVKKGPGTTWAVCEQIRQQLFGQGGCGASPSPRFFHVIIAGESTARHKFFRLQESLSWCVSAGALTLAKQVEGNVLSNNLASVYNTARGGLVKGVCGRDPTNSSLGLLCQMSKDSVRRWHSVLWQSARADSVPCGEVRLLVTLIDLRRPFLAINGLNRSLQLVSAALRGMGSSCERPQGCPGHCAWGASRSVSFFFDVQSNDELSCAQCELLQLLCNALPPESAQYVTRTILSMHFGPWVYLIPDINVEKFNLAYVDWSIKMPGLYEIASELRERLVEEYSKPLQHFFSPHCGDKVARGSGDANGGPLVGGPSQAAGLYDRRLFDTERLSIILSLPPRQNCSAPKFLRCNVPPSQRFRCRGDLYRNVNGHNCELVVTPLWMAVRHGFMAAGSFPRSSDAAGAAARSGMGCGVQLIDEDDAVWGGKAVPVQFNGSTYAPAVLNSSDTRPVGNPPCTIVDGTHLDAELECLNERQQCQRCADFMEARWWDATAVFADGGR